MSQPKIVRPRFKSSSQYLEWINTLTKTEFKYEKLVLTETLDKLRKREYETANRITPTR